MWTNVFKIGGFRQVSWFQFIPHESDLNPIPDKSTKLEQKDAATLLVLSSHLELQKEGFLSAWTNSFVGPWDPSQGVHNPDEKIKLWLFLPGRYASVIECAQPAVSRLRVLASGVWLAPGDSEEVASALSQALRNRIERALNGLSYMRFGDVFSKYQPFSQREELFRRGQPVVEFVFAATEEAIFVHVLISAKHIRALSSSDMEKIQKDASNYASDRLPVIASPHGMRGRISAFCPSDLVKQVYLSSGKFRTSNGIVGLPRDVSQVSGSHLRGQSCYVEVTLGFPSTGNSDAHNLNLKKNLPKHHNSESSAVASGVQKGLHDQFSVSERTFIYPVEAVIVPVLQTSFARSSLKRFWMQNWIGPSLSGSPFLMQCVGERDSADVSWTKANGIRSEQDDHSSSNSISSSISSISGTSSDSDCQMAAGVGELEADADSLTSRQSGLSSYDQLPNNGSKPGSKRPRPGMGETFGQAALVSNGPIQDAYKSDYGSLEVNNSSITGVANDVGSHWDWEDDNRGMDIQALLSEFGDFGDFFENDALPFGEPPGTAESQALVFSIPDSGDLVSSPNTGIMDVADQMLLPVGFPSFDNFNQPPVATEEIPSKNQEVVKNAVSSVAVNTTPASSFGEFDHLVKAEALMTFAPEYGAIDMVTSEFSTSIFSKPYIPKSRILESTNSSPESYVYSATPPSSPCLDGSDEKHGIAVKSKACSNRQDSSASLHQKTYYTVIERGKEHDKRLIACNNSVATRDVATPSSLSGFNYHNADNSGQKKTYEATVERENFLMATRTVLATEVECLMFQASMCRIRHTLTPSCSLPSMGSIRLAGNSFLNQVHNEPNTATGNVFSKYEVKKKDSIPVRLAGDIDSGLLEGPLSAPVGVWRSVGVPKVAKPSMSPSMEICPSLPSHSSEEGILSYGQRQPLQEFLDGLALLVQQATSFVDVALDADCGDGPYGWLALEEQWRRGLACGPSMVHAGCGGSLASCHSLDIAGVELVDPLLADVHASSVVGLLQSDIKTALKSSFGTLDGPLSVTEWCKGRSGDAGVVGDGFASELIGGECRDSSSTVTLPVGEPLSPSQSSALGSLGLKGGGRVEETSQWRSNQETFASESEQQLGFRLRPSLFVLPAPAILVGIVVGRGSFNWHGAFGGYLGKVDCFMESDLVCVGNGTEDLFWSRILFGLDDEVHHATSLWIQRIFTYRYQDDWLKTSASSLQLWEKAPLEPYALQKHMTYCVICPDIDPLTTAAADFFQQLSTVYDTCKLGTHSPQSLGNQMEIDSGKWSSSGFILLDCPQSMKIESSTASLVGSISDYFLSLSNGWDLTSFLKSLSKVLKALNLGSCFTSNPKEGSTGPCMVIYVVCPFPEPVAVLQTVIESSIAVGSILLSKDKERRSIIHNQVGKSLSCSASVDEASISNVLTLPGFCIPKLVLQIVTVDAIFRVTNPALNELVILKEISFTVYNKARRVSRGSSSTDVVQSSSMSSRSHSGSMQMTSPIPGMWKECIGPRITGPREGELDSTLRHGSWDSNTWQSSRAAGSFGIDPHRAGDSLLIQDEIRYMFEPLFILAEPGSLEHGVSPTAFANIASETSKPSLSDDCTSGSIVQSSVDATGPSSQSDGSEGADGFGSSGHQKTLPSLHCCYGWTEDWRWLVCVWTDSRGELLDSHIFPFGGISSRQDTKGLQSLFVQLLQQGCQILQSCSSPDSGVVVKPRDFVITRIGCFFELEYQEWQKALYSVGGCEVKKWPLQLRRSAPDGMLGSTNGTSLQQEQEMTLIQERTLPSSPSPLYSGHSKASGFVKGGGLGQPSGRKQLMGGPPVVDHTRGLLQCVQSISFISISVDHSLHLVFQADSASPGATQGSSSNVNASGGYIEGFTPVKSLGSASTSYVLIPSPSMRFIPPTPLQLPTCLTAESPPLAHLLHSKGSAIPLSTGFVVSKAVPSMGMGKDSSRRSNSSKEEEWPSVISVSLVDHYGNGSNNSNNIQEKTKRGVRVLSSEARDFEIETHLILESVAAELHALSWMTVSPAYLERRTALPFHCDMVLRLRRLLHFADKELSQSRRMENTQV